MENLYFERVEFINVVVVLYTNTNYILENNSPEPFSMIKKSAKILSNALPSVKKSHYSVFTV